MAALLDRVYDTLRDRAAPAGIVSRQRQADALRQARAVLDVAPVTPPEIIADAIAMTTRSLREVVGEVGVEDYLDEVFSSFCIGK